MRTFTPPAGTRFYAGVDLHARALFLVILDGDGQVRFARNLPANPDAFLRAVAPFRDGLLVACECMHCWYWLADTCRDAGIPFVLGHAYSMKAVHGYKSKCDRKDAEAIARLLKGGNFPPVRRRVETHLALLEPLDTTIRRLEAEIEDAARLIFPTELAVLQSTPGVGLVLSLTILLEIDTIDRFDSRQQFCSYARLCGAVQTSDNKRTGEGNRKAGNAWLKWAFSEAAVLSAQKDDQIGAYLQRLASRLGKAKALSALAHKLGRAFYHMLHTKEVFDVTRFVRH